MRVGVGVGGGVHTVQCLAVHLQAACLHPCIPPRPRADISFIVPSIREHSLIKEAVKLRLDYAQDHFKRKFKVFVLHFGFPFIPPTVLIVLFWPGNTILPLNKSFLSCGML